MSTTPDITQAPSPVPADWPDWFRARRALAWQRFLDLPAPQRSTEEWRYGSPKQLDNLRGLDLANIFPTAVEIDDLEEGEAYLFFSNGHFVYSGTALPEGVLVMPLSSAMKEFPDLVEQHFMQDESRLGSAKYVALHAAHLTDGVFIHVPAGIILDTPIQITHLIGGSSGAIFPHTLIVCGENAAVTVVEEFTGDSDDANFIIAVNDLVAQQGATLKYALFQNLNNTSRFLQLNSIRGHRDATVTSLILNTGASWARQESTSKLLGEGAESNMLSASIASGTQEYDQRTYQHHLVPRTRSDLLYRNTLLDSAKTSFSGMINVEQGAHFTDAYQTCNNLLLSDNAEANSLPGLEINADQVKCSHGTTNSTIEDDQIFYLLSRGIPAPQARQMIAQGFSATAIQRFGNEEVEAYALELAQEKFKGQSE